MSLGVVVASSLILILAYSFLILASASTVPALPLKVNLILYLPSMSSFSPLYVSFVAFHDPAKLFKSSLVASFFLSAPHAHNTTTSNRHTRFICPLLLIGVPGNRHGREEQPSRFLCPEEAFVISSRPPRWGWNC